MVVVLSFFIEQLHSIVVIVENNLMETYLMLHPPALHLHPHTHTHTHTHTSVHKCFLGTTMRVLVVDTFTVLAFAVNNHMHPVRHGLLSQCYFTSVTCIGIHDV